MTSELTQAQLDAYWMPFTGNRQFKQDPRLIASAKGRYYKDDKGRKIFDGLSGLWTCGLGHGHPKIAEAITSQVTQLDYSPAFQFGHAKAFQLAEKITEFLPAELNRIFYTSSGSEAVETALKIARAYWRKQGLASKTKLIGRGLGYHGVNFGGIAVGGIGPNKAPYGVGLDSDHIRSTVLAENKFCRGQPEHGAHLAEDLLELIALHDASNIAAVIVEPMAGSAGVIPPPQGYLQRLRDICKQHNILLIFDEVICAFGRIGSNTGAQAYGVTPDLMTIAKQLTNGCVPMGAVAAKQEIYELFMSEGGPEYMVELPHGYTYSAHPLACAAGLASLQALQDEQLVRRVAQMSPYFEQAVHQLKGQEWVSDIRNCGFAAGFTLETWQDQPAKRPFQVAMQMWQKGFYVRYGGATIQLGLPFTTTAEEIDSLLNALGESFNSVQ